MDVTLYRCKSAWLLVPSCFLPSREAVALHGEAEFHRSMAIGGPAWDALLDAMQERGFVALPLDHPLRFGPVRPAPAARRECPLPRRPGPGGRGAAGWFHWPRHHREHHAPAEPA